MNREQAIAIVVAGILWRGAPDDEARKAAIVERMVNLGECLWHASAQVSKAKCYCAACERVLSFSKSWPAEVSGVQS